MALLIPLDKLPLALDATVERVEPGTGLPTTATLDAEFALSEWTKRNVVDTEHRLTVVEGSTGTLSGRVEDIAEVVSNPDGSLTAHRLTNVSATATAAQGAAATAQGLAQDAIEVVANPDGSLTAGRLTNVATEVAGNTASLETLQSSVNGLSVRYAVVGNINNATGGFELTGIQRADGSGATFSFDIYANTRIHGDLVVDGTIDTPQMAPDSVSQTPVDGWTSATQAISTSTAGTYALGNGNLDYSLTYGAKCLLEIELSGSYAGTGAQAASLVLTIDGQDNAIGILGAPATNQFRSTLLLRTQSAGTHQLRPKVALSMSSGSVTFTLDYIKYTVLAISR